MTRFIDGHRARYGVEPICKALQVAPSTYYFTRQRLLGRGKSPRSLRDSELMMRIKSIWESNFFVYGVRKVWKALVRGQGIAVARCTVERLMQKMGLKGVVRGRRLFTTVSEPNPPIRPDLVNRDFGAERPNQLWLADFTYVRTKSGFVYVSFVVDAYSRRILGWKVSENMRTELVEAALNQAIASRDEGEIFGLVHHSDRGSQYTSVNYSMRMIEAGLMASVGRTGDSYDNAMAETIIGLYKAEVIQRQRSWSGLAEVEYATLEWVAWFNRLRLFSSIGYLTPEQIEMMYYEEAHGSAKVA